MERPRELPPSDARVVQERQGFPGWVLVTWAVGVATFEIVASAPGSVLLPPQPEVATPLQGVATHLGLAGRAESTLIVLSLIGIGATVGGFLLFLRQAELGRVPLKAAVSLSVVCFLSTLLLPLLYSRDVYSYTMYGRILSIYHLNPYTAPPNSFPSDPFYPLIGKDWQDTTPVYGPLFVGVATVLASAFRSVVGAVNAYRILAIATGLLTVGLVARTAQNLCPKRAAAAVVFLGMNPVVLFMTVASGHNDTLIALGIAAAMALIVANRGLLATLVLTLSTLVKIIAFLPLILWVGVDVARQPRGRRLRKLAHHLALLAGVTVPIVAPFLRRENPTLGQSQLATHIGATPANWIRVLAEGLGGVISPSGSELMSDVIRVLAIVLLVGTTFALGRSLVRRAASGKISAATVGAAWAWSLLIFQLLSLVFLPWYLVWVLPIAWLLPYQGRRFLVAMSVIQMFALVVADQELLPTAHNRGAWVALFLLAPLILVLAIDPVKSLVVPLRTGAALEAEDLIAT